LSSRRRLKLILVGLLFALSWGALSLLWQWKVPALVRLRLEQATGHRVSVGAVTINHRFELVVHDVRIAGAPPFEAQTLAWANRVVVRLGGAAGFWSPSEVTVDGLDVEYFGSGSGDNVRAPPVAAKAPASKGPKSIGRATPRLVLRHLRLRGSFVLPHAPRLEFRVPEAEIDRAPDGTLHASFHRAVVDVEGWASLRGSALTLRASARADSGAAWTLQSNDSVTVEVPGGGSLLDRLALSASMGNGSAELEIRDENDAGKSTLLGVHVSPAAVDATVDLRDLSLRPLAAAGMKPGLGLERARASLTASLAADRSTLQARFDVQGKLSAVDLLHSAVDASPWRNQSLAVDTAGTADLATGRLDITRGILKALAATVAVKGWLETRSPMRGALVVQTPRQAPLSCSALLRGQAEPVRQALAGLDLGGTLGFVVALEVNAANWDELRLDIDLSPRCSVLHEPEALAELLPALKKAPKEAPASTKFPLGPYDADFVALSQMPAHLPSAFLTAEDSKFFHHHGFDVEMIQHVLAQDLENRSFDRGASTITQQLAKNLFLNQRRTLARKLEEAVLTWRLQRLLSKERTLELYLNVIELGPGIRGVKQAARTYFGKEVGELTPLESAHLAALTPNPHVLARRFRDGQVDESWQLRLYDLLGMMKRHGRLSADELARARNSKLELRDLGK
jgi:hypothetical protein